MHRDKFFNLKYSLFNPFSYHLDSTVWGSCTTHCTLATSLHNIIQWYMNTAFVSETLLSETNTYFLIRKIVHSTYHMLELVRVYNSRQKFIQHIHTKMLLSSRPAYFQFYFFYLTFRGPCFYYKFISFALFFFPFIYFSHYLLLFCGSHLFKGHWKLYIPHTLDIYKLSILLHSVCTHFI